MDNPKTLKNLLERLTDLLINHQYDNNLLDQARKIVLKVITKHLEIIKVEIAAIAALFYIVNNESQSLLLEDVIKKRIVTRIISLILYHDYDARILTWAFLTLDRLMLRWGFEKNHQYVMYLFQYFLRISLCIISADNQDYTLKIACVLINWCALGGTRIHRIYLGKSGTIKKLIVIIKTRIRQNTFEQVELAFETINHLTNDLPRNCKRFLDQKGLQYMFECLRTFPNKILMKQNIYCVLRNIAEIKELRGKLMKNHLIEVLFDNLRLTGDEIQIRYYAAEIIVHLASDGHKAWTIQSPTRCEVLDHMTRALQSWNLDVILDIRYRSVKTLLKIAQISHTPVCVQWAAWTLANLTRVYPEKYCSTVITEDGINIMSQVLKENYQISQQEVIHNLAQTVINQCMSFEENITE
ncbi:Armadillo-type fold,Armadillo-like helical [Cinara cedri]|uniref:Armadillo-type fold,Armadillo-like helical n=1 Tax=Cinara cedri TaxID=506608 RepID=A0A5E4NR55_9HEMI|nr:Armadillo-type fold,Armadillo-like helical [Cinara cedri]